MNGYMSEEVIPVANNKICFELPAQVLDLTRECNSFIIVDEDFVVAWVVVLR